MSEVVGAVSYEVRGVDRKRLAAVVRDADDAPIAVQTSAGVIELPSAASAAVRHLLSGLAAGSAVHVIADDVELTTKQAGDLLGISRTYVARLVDQGKIAGHRVGTHRRLRAADVVAYMARRSARLAAVDAIAAADHAAGLPHH